MKDLTGQRFGRLVALQPTEKRVDQLVVWRCRCDCGNEVEAVGAHLTKGSVRSCGCLRREKVTLDLTGQRFGRLIALRPTDKRVRSSVVWECACDCGNSVEAPVSALRSGQIRSCGCMRARGPAKDIAGQRFGRLTAIRPIGRKHRGILWECACDCGNVKQATTNQLTSGKVRSCGCLRKDGTDAAAKLVGQRFGRLKVIGPAADKPSSGPAKCHCRCDCGHEIDVSIASLRSGNTRSCGCLKAESARRDIAGQRFGKLVAVNPTGASRGGSAVWHCACDCGNTCEETLRRLAGGSATNCGCEPSPRLPRNIAGRRFGRLTAIEPTNERDRGSVVWRCVCECGTFTNVSRRRLQDGTATSCGCEAGA